MLGKTFKGMTDEMLAWQTERFARAGDRRRRLGGAPCGPEQVVEIAFDGLQRSTALPGRASRCGSRACCATATTRRPAEADTIDTVRALAGRP